MPARLIAALTCLLLLLGQAGAAASVQPVGGKADGAAARAPATAVKAGSGGVLAVSDGRAETAEHQLPDILWFGTQASYTRPASQLDTGRQLLGWPVLSIETTPGSSSAAMNGGSFSVGCSPDGLVWSVQTSNVSTNVSEPYSGHYTPNSTWSAPRLCRHFRLLAASGVGTVQRFKVVADVNGSLAGRYFLASGATSAFAFWFRVGGRGSSPGVVTLDGLQHTPVAIDIAENATASGVADAVAAALAGVTNIGQTSLDGGMSWLKVGAVVPGGFSAPFGLAHGNGVFLMASAGKTLRSYDGVNWDYFLTAPNPTVNVASLVWFQPAALWVLGASGASGPTASIWTSPNGEAWTARTTGATISVNRVCTDGQLLLAVAGNQSTNVYAYSSNGVGWTESTLSNTAVRGMCVWDGFRFLVGDAGGNAIASASGTGGWTSTNAACGGTASMASNGAGRMACVADAFGPRGLDVNGQAWVAHETFFNDVSTLDGLQWDASRSRFVMMEGHVYTSQDGVAWGSRDTLADNYTAHKLAVSPDGTWFARPILTTVAEFSSAYAQHFDDHYVGFNTGSSVLRAADPGTSGFTYDAVYPPANMRVKASVRVLAIDPQ